MSVMKLFYESGYRHSRMPWDIGPRVEIVELKESGCIKTCRAIDLGSGAARQIGSLVHIASQEQVAATVFAVCAAWAVAPASAKLSLNGFSMSIWKPLSSAIITGSRRSIGGVAILITSTPACSIKSCQLS